MACLVPVHIIQLYMCVYIKIYIHFFIFPGSNFGTVQHTIQHIFTVLVKTEGNSLKQRQSFSTTKNSYIVLISASFEAMPNLHYTKVFQYIYEETQPQMIVFWVSLPSGQ